MGRLAVIAGHSLLGGTFAASADIVDVSVADTSVRVLDAGEYCFLQRHGTDPYRPPHRVDHVANLRALHSIGCDRILAIGSVGGLRSHHRVGDALAPHDFIALDHVVTAYDDDRGHRVPGFAPEWRRAVIDEWDHHAPAPVTADGVYWQTNGPRFETAAEIRLLATFADVVGMTIASECIVAGELDLSYAAICIVDNLANGLRPDPLTVDEFESGKLANREHAATIIEHVAQSLGS